ncbi:MAG: DUF790 family protein [Myxococcaceae bacterium]|nr:DUF790 family protein [Myxococcaceae bacterium]MCI0670932.1 DUF790 family protein [Myxococcaceae bacterium]
MLTRGLLRQRVRDGVLRPLFVDVDALHLRSLAERMVGCVAAHLGHPREEVEETLAALAGASRQPQVARGLSKLLVDRMEFAAASEEASARRSSHVHVAAAVLRELPEEASFAEYEARLGARLPAGLGAAREELYADLPAVRPLTAWEALSPRQLLERYNLALAQGPLLSARSVTLRAFQPELLRVRRVLRWLRFCRLVAEVRRVEEDWVLEVEGPGAVVDLQKKYGLQLATFLTVVPELQRWELTARVESRGHAATLRLTDADPLVSPHPSALGWLPPELRVVEEAFAQDAEWALDLTPTPRHVGTRGTCVPDLTFRHRESGREVAVEFFHPWHAAVLARRREELRTRADPGLLLGVDRSLARTPELRAVLEADPQVVLFNTYPSVRKLRETLARFT